MIIETTTFVLSTLVLLLAGLVLRMYTTRLQLRNEFDNYIKEQASVIEAERKEAIRKSKSVTRGQVSEKLFLLWRVFLMICAAFLDVKRRCKLYDLDSCFPIFRSDNDRLITIVLLSSEYRIDLSKYLMQSKKYDVFKYLDNLGFSIIYNVSILSEAVLPQHDTSYNTRPGRISFTLAKP